MRCTLEPFSVCYLGKMREYLSDPDVVRYLPLVANHGPDGVISWLSRGSHSASDHVFSIFRAIPAEKHEVTPDFVGITILRAFQLGGPAAEGGIIIGAKHLWGTRIGFEAKVLQLDYAFFKLAVDRVFSSIVAANRRAEQLLLRLGYVRLPGRPDGYPGSSAGDRLFFGLSLDQWLSTKPRISREGEPTPLSRGIMMP
jgi:RimJ/RimL family protein N-acetyltransferase